MVSNIKLFHWVWFVYNSDLTNWRRSHLPFRFRYLLANSYIQTLCKWSLIVFYTGKECMWRYRQTIKQWLKSCTNIFLHTIFSPYWWVGQMEDWKSNEHCRTLDWILWAFLTWNFVNWQRDKYSINIQLYKGGQAMERKENGHRRSVFNKEVFDQVCKRNKPDTCLHII